IIEVCSWATSLRFGAVELQQPRVGDRSGPQVSFGQISVASRSQQVFLPLFFCVFDFAQVLSLESLGLKLVNHSHCWPIESGAVCEPLGQARALFLNHRLASMIVMRFRFVRLEWLERNPWINTSEAGGFVDG